LLDAIKKKTTNAKFQEDDDKFFKIYLRLGHINLLAEDFAKGTFLLNKLKYRYNLALSAYQKSYKYNKEGFWKDPAALYGLALTYYHFQAYHP
jgi:hypothetical protein